MNGAEAALTIICIFVVFAAFIVLTLEIEEIKFRTACIQAGYAGVVRWQGERVCVRYSGEWLQFANGREMFGP